MSTLSGVIAGALALVALEAAVSSQDAAGAISATGKAAAGLVGRLVDPTVPAVPDLRGRKTSSGPQLPSLTPTPAATTEPPPVPQPVGGGRYRT